jgi:hypothetical protein
MIWAWRGASSGVADRRKVVASVATEMKLGAKPSTSISEPSRSGLPQGLVPN